MPSLPPSLPCTTINVTSLKGCRPRPRPAPTPLVLHRLPLTSILSPRLFPSHPLILVLGIRWWGRGEQEVVPRGDLGYQSCSPLPMLDDIRRDLTERLSGAPSCALLDEISGGCLSPALLGTCQQCWGVTGPLSLLMWLWGGLEGGQPPLLMPKEIPHPTLGSPALVF